MSDSPTMTALYLRDHFFLRYFPQPGDEKTWRRIENATIRIAESVAFMLKEHPHEPRLVAAKRIRRAARECVRLIPTLAAVDPWTLETAKSFEALADKVIDELATSADRSRPH